MEVRKHLELNDNGKMPYCNLRDAVKTLPRGKFTRAWCTQAANNLGGTVLKTECRASPRNPTSSVSGGPFSTLPKPCRLRYWWWQAGIWDCDLSLPLNMVNWFILGEHHLSNWWLIPTWSEVVPHGAGDKFRLVLKYCPGGWDSYSPGLEVSRKLTQTHRAHTAHQLRML